MSKKQDNILTRLQRLRFLKNWHGLLPLAVFLVLAVPTGLFLVFNVPAMWAPDGGAHIARVFQISEGGFRPVFINHKKGIGYGGSIPFNISELKNLELGFIGGDGLPGEERNTPLLTKQQKQEISAISNQKISKQLQLISYVNTALYSPFAYAPSVVGVVIGKTMDFNIGHTLELAGLFGLATYLLCVGYGLYTLRRSQYKWLVFTVSLLPLSVFQVSVISADSFLMSVLILFSALMMKAFSGKLELNTLDKILLFGCVIVLPWVKTVYFPLVLLILFIPKTKWSNIKSYWSWTISALAISTAGFLVWTGMTLDVAASNGLVRPDNLWAYGDAKVQEKFILHHPLKYIQAFIDTLIYQAKFLTDTYFGWLGFTYLPIPGFAQVAGFFSIGLSVLVTAKERVSKYIPIAIAVLILLITGIIFTTFYISFTPPGTGSIEGVQGRYFLPITILILFAVSAFLPKFRVATESLASAKIILVCLVAFCLILSVYRYGLAIV